MPGPRTDVAEFRTLLNAPTAFLRSAVLAFCIVGSSHLSLGRRVMEKPRAYVSGNPRGLHRRSGARLVGLLVASPHGPQGQAQRWPLGACRAGEEEAKFPVLDAERLSTRAHHPSSSLRMLHGNLFDIKCFNRCGYVEPNILRDPVCPALAPASEDYPPDQTMPLLDPAVPTPPIKVDDLPHCPKCKEFNEPLPDGPLDETDRCVKSGDIDIMLVIGTAAAVYPAAGYTQLAQRQGAIVVVINPDPKSGRGLRSRDFFFQGDAAEMLPRLLECDIGELEIPNSE